MDRSVQTRYLHENKQRIIAISDIHGNLSLLKTLLDQVHYDEYEDTLLFLGDLIEKGNENLATLRYIMNLCQNGNAYALMGNCDFVCKNIVHHYNLHFLNKILCQRQASILHEMAAQIGISIDQSTDMELLCDRLLAHFFKELHWVDTLPQVIYTDNYIFVHAGILNEQTFGSDFREVLTFPHFLLNGKDFKHYVVAGHMPVSEYCQDIACFNPIINEQKHIICIDGGNMVKKAGQLNALIIQNDRFSFKSADSLPLAQALCDVNVKNQDPLFITWRESEIVRLEKGEKRDFCLHLSSGKKLWIDHAFLHNEDGKWKADDFTTYQMPLKRGEYVSIVKTYDQFALIKKEGILGWCRKEHLRC